jgi:cytochrome c oxidase subunit I+III
VAHLHYVLVGGLVLPVFGAIYYWAPLVSGRAIPGSRGKWACGLMFAGVNVTFFPLLAVGLLGMPRRVWTYPEGLGWEPWNMAATLGAFILAAGILLACLDIVVNLRVRGKVNTNPWNAATLEWLPMDDYAVRSIPLVTSREPLWDNPRLRQEVDEGRHFMPGLVTGTRETIVTSPIEAQPEYVLRLPGPSWLPLVAGAGTAAFFYALTLKQPLGVAAAAAITLAAVVAWLWRSDPAPGGALHHIGGGVRLPDYMSGHRSQAWWATAVLLIVDGMTFVCLAFSYFYLWIFAPRWTTPDLTQMPEGLMLGAAALWLLASGFLAWSGRALARRRRVPRAFMSRLIAALVVLCGAWVLQATALESAGVQPDRHAYGAIAYTMLGYQGLHVVLLTLMAVYTLVRAARRLLDHERRNTFDTLRLIWHYSAAQGVLTVVLTLLPGIRG